MSLARAASMEPSLKSAAPASARGATLQVRPAGPSDAAPLGFFFDTVLRKDYFLKRGQLNDILSGKHHRVFAAELDGVLVGVAIVSAGARLVNALVHPAYRGLGIGRALIDASGVREVRAKIDMSTGDPRDFYRRLGFDATGQKNDKGNIELMRKSGAAREPSECSGQPAEQDVSAVDHNGVGAAADTPKRKRQTRRAR